MTLAFTPRTLARIAERGEQVTRAPQQPADWAAGRGITLWSAQETIAASVAARKRTAVRAAHAVGKSYLAAVLTAWWVDTHPRGMVITTAPTRDQVHGILWEEIRDLHTRLRLPGRTLDNDQWKTGSRIVAWGRKPPDKAAGSDFDPSTFQGYHRADGVLVILDEAGGIPEWLWNSSETITTEPASRILAIGNPDNPGSHFAEVCKPGHPGWAQHKIAIADSPNFTSESAGLPSAVAAALVGRQWEAERREEWGADNPLYISKVLAEFPSDSPHQVIPTADLAACRIGEPRSAVELLPVELGVDVGGGGDLTIIRERRGVQAGRRWAERTRDPEAAGRLLTHAVNVTAATSVKIDATGVGFGLVGEMRLRQSRGDIPAGTAIHGVMVGAAASDPAKLANLRAEIWWQVGRVASQQRAWDLAAMAEPDQAVAELLTPRWRLDPKGRVLVEPKDDIRGRTGGRSPDDADALLLAYYVPADGQGSYFAALTSGRLGGPVSR